jgi:NADH:ubiquinone oxidoreductase subunit B-like Fe-S oxidoreductase
VNALVADAAMLAKAAVDGKLATRADASKHQGDFRAIVQGVDHVVPVDIYLPGCPPRPEMLFDAILKLHDKIQDTKLGPNRKAEIIEQEQLALAAPSTLEMKGLLR